jgi:hypothetical protein
MGGGQAGAPADDHHVPWSRPPRRGHRDLTGHGAGRPGWAGPDPGTGAGKARIRPERPTGRGRGEAVGGSGEAEKNLPKSRNDYDAATKNKIK